MTYCLAIQLDEGLVFCSDSRTNAGADRVSTYSKMHRFAVQGDRSLILLTAGNLATSQAVVSQIQRDLQENSEFNISDAKYVSDIADYIGQLNVAEQEKHRRPGGPDAEGFNASASFILGGQVKGQPSELYLIYPEGNHITASEQHPYLQIGETKYGKPILDRIIQPDTSPEIAMRCGLLSIDSTMRSVHLMRGRRLWPGLKENPAPTSCGTWASLPSPASVVPMASTPIVMAATSNRLGSLSCRTRTSAG